MSYPLQSLTIIAPILFIVLMAGIPVIGIFAGWKRAAYWGGGTFLFFIIGMIIWKTCGTAIVNTFINQLTNLLKGMGIKPTTKALVSLCAPIFFLLIMMVAELLLLINYYAWFKKVSKIKQDIAAKKAYKLAKKTSKKAPKNVKGWTAMQFTTQGKAINMACGGVGLALLLAPSTITFTQAVMYTTTSVDTRANSAFCSFFYNGLEKVNNAFSWMSYYGKGETATDFNSLMSGIALYSQKMCPIDPKTGEPSTDQKSVVECVGLSMGNGIQNIVNVATTETSTDPKTKLDNIAKAVNNFAASWNEIIKNAGSNVGILFNSSNITEVVQETIKSFVSEPISLTDEQIEATYGDGTMFANILWQIKQGYAEGKETINVDYEYTTGKTVSAEFTALKSTPVTKDAFDNIKNSFYNIIKKDQLSDKYKTKFDTVLTDIVSMLFYVA